MTTLILNSELQGGKYTIKKALGQGGFGVTYLAQHNLLNRQVAIKEFFMKDYCIRVSNTNTMQVGVPEKKIFVERFRTQFIREAQKIASLNHDNIIKIHDIFEENNTAYYVMEYHENGSLADLISRYPNGLSEEMAIAYISEVASAVGYIHDNRIMHLDIKPANILLNDKNSPILIDFGSSRLYNPDGNLDTTTLVGVSEGYAPIEQYIPGGVSHFCPQTDIYSLAATLYTLLKGNRPLNAFEIRQAGFASLRASASVVSAIKMAMSNDIEQRPKSVKHFVDLLLSDQSTISLPAATPQLIPVEPKFDEKDCFIKLECSKSSVSVGEEILVSLNLYWRNVRLREEDVPYIGTSLDCPGFRIEHLFGPFPTSPQIVNDVAGIEYEMSTLGQWGLVVIQDGYLTIQSWSFDMNIGVIAFVNADGSYNLDKDEYYKNIEISLKSNSCEIYADKKFINQIERLGDVSMIIFHLYLIPLWYSLKPIISSLEIKVDSRLWEPVIIFAIVIIHTLVCWFIMAMGVADPLYMKRIDKAKNLLLKGNYDSVKRNLRIASFNMVLYVFIIVILVFLVYYFDSIKK